MKNLSKIDFNKKHLKHSDERKLIELINEIRACIGTDATLAAKVNFNPRKALNKFNTLIDKVINSIKSEREQAVLKQVSHNFVDCLDKQLAVMTERSNAFREFLEQLASGNKLIKSNDFEHSNALADWLNEIDPLSESVDIKQLSFKSLKADTGNVPRDFLGEEQYSYTRATEKIDDFFLPEYLESANEAEITDDILEKANELNNNPVKIYEWVHNNVEWQPTWGGQQTADMTLDVLRGNAMDISTLLIALLRAAKIPARYVYGSVDIAVDKFINMAGNFDNLDSAMEFVSAGGVPVTSIISGGKISKVRMEHVWVEAAVPFYPSRGSKPVSKRNPIDSWVPLDGSAKQYIYFDGMDCEGIISNAAQNIDINLDEILNIDKNENSFKILDSDFSLNSFQETKDLITDNLDKITDLSEKNVIGGREIIIENFNYLPGTLPYKSVSKGIKYAKLIESLQTLVTLSLDFNRYSEQYLESKSYPLYKLNQESISISFRPATDSDEKLFESYFPKVDPDRTDINDINSALPKFFPSSINVIPEIKLDEKVILSGASLPFGEEVQISYKINHPQKLYFNHTYKVVAGSYLALGVVGSNLSQKTYKQLRLKISQVIEQISDASYSQLTKQTLFGDAFVATILYYYYEFISQTHNIGIQKKMNYVSMPTMGTFGHEPYQRKIFGINRGIEPYGLFMNVYTVHIAQSRTKESEDNKKEFNMQVGILSSMLEHVVPERVYSQGDLNDKNDLGCGFSAMKALGLAKQNDQRFFIITPENQTTALNKINHDAASMREIRDALNAGMHVITHTDPVKVPGYKGSGYIILNPLTGEGAYRINGGKNGGFLFGIYMANLLSLLIVFLFSSPASFFITIIMLSGPQIYLLKPIFDTMNKVLTTDPKVRECFLTGFLYAIFPLGGAAIKAVITSMVAKGQIAAALQGIAAVWPWLNNLKDFFIGTATPISCLRGK